ncbi:MAG: AAA family ATPase [bacterium]
MSVQAELSGLYKDISNIVIGKSKSVILTLTAVLCRGHLLIEDYPGLGKTLLAHSVARGLALDFKRVQCTPDLLPADITGGAIFRHSSESFEFIKGPVFTDILLVDEINRSSPRTQSSLLEAMAENQVTAEGNTYPLSDQFLIIATQNPVELHGTYPLPEAQLDRFFMRIDMGYPDVESEMKILQGHGADQKVALKPRISRDSLGQLQQLVHKVPVKPEVSRYCLDIVRATREHEEVALGVSPRGSIALYQAAQAFAMITNKNLVTPQVVKNVSEPVLAHRITLRQQKGDHHARANMIQKILSTVPVP